MWVAMPLLRSIIGSDLAVTLCNNMGGVPIYVPNEAHSGHALAKVVGLRGMELLCARFPGEYITVPNGTVQKDQIQEMLKQGKTKIEIALACGVTERYVYMLAGLDSDSPEEHAGKKGQLTLF